MRGVLILGLVVLAFASLAWLGQRRMVYFPSQVVSAERSAGVEDVRLSTDDGLDLTAWFVPGRTATDAPLVGATIVVFPGNGGNRVGRLPLARRLSEAGAGVLLVDYRGYGGNPGRPSSDGLARDARAALAWAARRDDVAMERLVYLGESLGAAVAVELATEHPPSALVLRSPFTSLADVAAEHYGLVPGWFLRDRWPNRDRIATVDVPTLVVAGQADRIVPVAQSRDVAEAAGGTTTLVVVPGAGHNDPGLAHGRSLVDPIVDFLADHLPAS